MVLSTWLMTLGIGLPRYLGLRVFPCDNVRNGFLRRVLRTLGCRLTPVCIPCRPLYRMLTGPATSEYIRWAALRTVRLACVILTLLGLLLKSPLYVLRERTLMHLGATTPFEVLTIVLALTLPVW